MQLPPPGRSKILMPTLYLFLPPCVVCLQAHERPYLSVGEFLMLSLPNLFLFHHYQYQSKWWSSSPPWRILAETQHWMQTPFSDCGEGRWFYRHGCIRNYIDWGAIINMLCVGWSMGGGMTDQQFRWIFQTSMRRMTLWLLDLIHVISGGDIQSGCAIILMCSVSFFCTHFSLSCLT